MSRSVDSLGAGVDAAFGRACWLGAMGRLRQRAGITDSVTFRLIGLSARYYQRAVSLFLRRRALLGAQARPLD